MRKIGDIISIISSFKPGSDKIFKELSLDEIKLTIDYFANENIIQVRQTFNMSYKEQFIMEYNRRVGELRDKKLIELGI